MANLFSSFDPQSVLQANLNWLASFTCLVLMPPLFWATSNKPLIAARTPIDYVWGELKAVTKSSSVPGILIITVSIFGLIALNNFMGLFPYIFTATRHPAITVTLALPIWLGHIILGIAQTPQNILAHLVPLGTPNALIPFMVLIEIVRRIIRPLTLRVRLAANMIAGHLLLTLLGNQGPLARTPVLPLILSALIALAVLECAVAIIQAYVFSVLSTLYVEEVNRDAIN